VAPGRAREVEARGRIGAEVAREVVELVVGPVCEVEQGRVRDDHVELPELLDRTRDERVGNRGIPDVAAVGDGNASEVDDLLRDARREARIGVVPIGRHAQVVDDHLRPTRRELHRVRASDRAAGARDDRHAPFEAEVGHVRGSVRQG